MACARSGLCLVVWLCIGMTLFAEESLDEIRSEIQRLHERVSKLEAENEQLKQRLVVDRMVVRKELIVSDTENPWEDGLEEHQIPRGIYARSLWDGPGGLWVRSRLIKGEIDDPFDDRFHAIESNGEIRRVSGHISWNVWIDGAWRQLAIVQGEALEPTEIARHQWSGGNHPGRLRFQTFRPNHPEPLTDALIGQGMMSLGGGGYGGGGLPYPTEVLQLWGGEMQSSRVANPDPPVVVADDGSGPHQYVIVAWEAHGRRSATSPSVDAQGLARLRWDGIIGADTYQVIRDGKVITEPLRIEGARKIWQDPASSLPTSRP